MSNGKIHLKFSFWLLESFPKFVWHHTSLNFVHCVYFSSISHGKALPSQKNWTIFIGHKYTIFVFITSILFRICQILSFFFFNFTWKFKSKSKHWRNWTSMRVCLHFLDFVRKCFNLSQKNWTLFIGYKYILFVFISQILFTICQQFLGLFV